MRILKAELVNFCQYEDFKIEFSPGLTAIVGSNGCGKSNLVKGIHAAVTGDFGRNDGNKDKNINVNSHKDAPAYVRVLIEHDGLNLDITRGLRNTRNELIITDQFNKQVKVSDKVTEITDNISHVLGITPKIVSDYVFIDQWSMFNFLNATTTERAKIFQRLFRTEQIEKLYKVIDDHQRNIKIPVIGLDKDKKMVDLNKLKAEYVELTIQMLQLEKELKEINKDECLKIISDYKDKCALLSTKATVGDQLKNRTADYDIKNQKYTTEHYAPIGNLSNYLGSYKLVYEDACKDLENCKLYEDMTALREHIQIKIEDYQVWLDNAKIPSKKNVQIFEDKEYEVFKKSIQELRTTVSMYKRYLDSIDNMNSCCLYCGTPRDFCKNYQYPSLDYKLKTAEAALALKEEIDRRWLEYSNKDKIYRETFAKYTDLVNDYKDQLSKLPSIKNPGKDKEALIKIKTDYENKQKELNEKQKQARIFSEEVNALWDDVKSKQKELKNIEEKLKKYEAITIIEHNKASQDLAFHKALSDKLIEVNTKIEMLAKSIAKEESELKQIKEVEEKATKLTDWSNYCEELKHIAHRDNWPRAVAKNYLSTIETYTNDLLNKFESEFLIQLNDDLSFTAKFKNGKEIQATRLSGGEKVILSLAFRVAVNDIFTKDLNLLCLDEPTAGLDNANIDCLSVAIDKLKQLSNNCGLQVLLITHETKLAHMFDNVIDLNKK